MALARSPQTAWSRVNNVRYMAIQLDPANSNSVISNSSPYHFPWIRPSVICYRLFRTPALSNYFTKKLTCSIPNGLDQRLSFLGSQRFVPMKTIKRLETVCVAKFANKEYKKASGTRVSKIQSALSLYFANISARDFAIFKET